MVDTVNVTYCRHQSDHLEDYDVEFTNQSNGQTTITFKLEDIIPQSTGAGYPFDVTNLNTTAAQSLTFDEINNLSVPAETAGPILWRVTSHGV